MNTLTGWQHKRLTELADYINGFAFKPEHWGKDGLPIIRIEQLKNPDSIADHFSGKLPEKNVIEDGDLIFSWSASLFLRIWAHGRAVLNQHLFKVEEKDWVDRLFLKQFIEHYLPEITKASHGSTMQHITRKELDRFGALFPVDKPEQTKIAEVLSTVDRVIEQTEALIAKQQRIKTGLMQDLLTKGIDEHGNLRNEATHQFKDSPLGRIPVEWDVCNVIDISTKVTDGDHHTPKRSDSGYFLLSARNVNDGFIDISDVDYVEDVEYRRMLRRCNPETGDILISCSGTIGRVCAVPDWLKCVLVRSAALVKLRREVVGTRFTEWTMRSSIVQRQMLMAQRQAAQPNLFQGEIEALQLPIPSLTEQDEISRRLDAVQFDTNSSNSSLQKLRHIKTALMQDLLTGKKRVTPLLETATTD